MIGVLESLTALDGSFRPGPRNLQSSRRRIAALPHLLSLEVEHHVCILEPHCTCSGLRTVYIMSEDNVLGLGGENE